VGTWHELLLQVQLRNRGNCSENLFCRNHPAFDVFEAPNIPLKTLDQSWTDTELYVDEACMLLRRQKPGYSLTAEERSKVISRIGEPPEPSWPLYFLAVGDYPDERIVYVGKTNSKTHRFATGHAAITELHRPQFCEKKKRLYLASVTILSDEENYVPLE